MEFEEQFAVIQGALITMKKKLGSLDMLSSNKDDDLSKMKNVTKVISDVLHGGKNTKGRLDDNGLRKVHMFLLLNTNWKVKSELEEDDNCGHIVGCAPIISKDLYVELVYSLALHKYLCEAIVYTPFCLGAELLQSAFTKFATLEFSEKLEKTNEYGTAVYHKFRLLEFKSAGNKSNAAKLNLYNHFKKVLKVFQEPSSAHLSSNTSDLYNIAGLAINNLLELLNNCLKLYVSPTSVNFDHRDTYSLNIGEDLDGSGEETNITAESFLVNLLDTCNTNLQAITVDIFLYWAELFSDTEDEKSLQQMIREAMYHCAQSLKAAQKVGFSSNSAEQVMSALVSMGDKPRDEDDEIKDADLSLMIKNVADKSKSQSKWFKALAQYPVQLSHEGYFTALEQHASFADFEDLKAVVDKTMEELSLSDSVMDKEALRTFVLTAVKRLSVNQQLVVLDWFFLKYGINTLLKKEDFNLEIVHTFNKSVHLSKEEMELVSEFIYLCLQSPCDVIARMIREGLSGTEQAALMVQILKCLSPVENMYVISNGEVEYSNTEKDAIKIVMHNVQGIMKEGLNEKEKLCFVPLIATLANNSLIDVSRFIIEILLPHIHDTYRDNQEDVLLYLETLSVLMDGDLLHSLKQLCPLMVFLGYLLERWNIYTFSTRSVLLCEKVQVLLKRIFKAFVDEKTEEDNEIRWLRFEMRGLAPLNKCYFKEAWTKFGRSWTTNMNTVDVIVLELMHGDLGSVSLRTQSLGDIKDGCIAYSLAKILPQCTPLEWKLLSRHMGKLYSNLPDDKTRQQKVAESFTDSLLILIESVDWQNAHSCLDYCVRNVAMLIKEEILPKLKDYEGEVLTTIFQKLCYVLGLLPCDVREQCCTAIANILVDVVQKAAHGTKENTLQDLITALGFLREGKALQVLANTLLELKRTQG